MAKKTSTANPSPSKASPASAKTRRVTIRRRAHEYDHQYGLPLSGRAAKPSKKAAKAGKAD